MLMTTESASFKDATSRQKDVSEAAGLNSAKWQTSDPLKKHTWWGRPRDSQRLGAVLAGGRTGGWRSGLTVVRRSLPHRGTAGTPAFPASVWGSPHTEASRVRKRASLSFLVPNPTHSPSPAAPPSTSPARTGGVSPLTSCCSLQAWPTVTWCPVQSPLFASYLMLLGVTPLPTPPPRARCCPLCPWPRPLFPPGCRGGVTRHQGTDVPGGSWSDPREQGGQTSCQVPSLAVLSTTVAGAPQEAAPHLGRGRSPGRRPCAECALPAAC